MDIKLIIDRSKEILFNPKAEWQKINEETTGTKDVLMGFVLPYLILNFIASIIGNFLFKTIFFSPLYFIAFAFVNLFVYLIILYITPVILQALAKSFSAEVDKVKAFKLVSYSFTPSYIIGIIVGLLPLLSIFGIVGLYGLYIMWVGFDILLKVPEDKKVGFYIVSILIIIGEFLILSLILGAILLSFFATGSFLYNYG
jgi:hypothetical protein